MSLLLCSRPGKPGFVFCAFYPLSPGERGRVRGSGRTGLHIAPGDSHPTRGVQHAKKKPAFSCELFFKYGGEGGIDSLRSPCGQTVRYALSLSNWLSPVVEPRSGILIPPQACNMRKKSPHFHASSSLNMAVRGGLTRFARPAGRLFATLSVCPTGCRQLSNPGRGFSSPRRRATCEKKARIFMRALL